MRRQLAGGVVGEGGILLASGQWRILLDALAHGGRGVLGGGRGKPRLPVLGGHQNEALARLRNAVVLGIQKARVGAKTVRFQHGDELLVDVQTEGVVQARHVFHDHEVRRALGDDLAELQQQGFSGVFALGRVQGGERLAWRAGGIEGDVVRAHAQFGAQRIDVHCGQVASDEATGLVVVLIGAAEALVVVQARDNGNARVQQAAAQAAGAAAEVDGFDVLGSGHGSSSGRLDSGIAGGATRSVGCTAGASAKP